MWHTFVIWDEDEGKHYVVHVETQTVSDPTILEICQALFFKTSMDGQLEEVDARTPEECGYYPIFCYPGRLTNELANPENVITVELADGDFYDLADRKAAQE